MFVARACQHLPAGGRSHGRRFPYYHPGFFNGIFTFAQVAACLARDARYAGRPLGVGVVLVFLCLVHSW